MRRQYHSKIVNQHTHVWDVHRLIELSRHLPLKELALESIAELDECFWFQDVRATCKSVALHAKLIAQTDLRFPIILDADGRVMDGMHRVCKAFLEGRKTVAAVQFAQTPAPDFVDVDVDVEGLSYDEPW